MSASENIYASISGISADFIRIYYLPTPEDNHGTVSAAISDITIDFINVRTQKKLIYVAAYDGGESVRSSAEVMAKVRDKERVTSTRVVRLPFTLEAFDEDAILAINMNFQQIEYHLSVIQKYMLSKGFASLTFPLNSTENIVLYGLDHKKPENMVGRNGRYFYWATDTKRLYVLFPIRRPPSPKVSVAIGELSAFLMEVFYATASASENISASIGVSVSFTKV